VAEFYQGIRLLHIGAVVASGMLFFLRGALLVFGFIYSVARVHDPVGIFARWI
jgi:hypothetical protein